MWFVPLLLLSQAVARPFPERSDWIDVPAFAVEAIDLASGSWMARDGHERRGEELFVLGRVAASGTLEVLASDFDGLWGVDLLLRVTIDGMGRVTVEASSSWHTGVGSHLGGPIVDLHGDVRIEERTAETAGPLRMGFRLAGIQANRGQASSPVLLEGGLEVAIAEPETRPVVSAPGWSPPLMLPRPEPADLREVSMRWPDGTRRTHGWVDTTGRRQGVWNTWYANGNPQSRSTFMGGERNGSWCSYNTRGSVYEQGLFIFGRRAGAWSKYGWGHDRLSEHGHYVQGQKQGEWTEYYADGRSVRARGVFEEGSKTGPWTAWWPNGNKQSKVSYQRGYPVGAWDFWNEDGSLKETRLQTLPPWARRASEDERER